MPIFQWSSARQPSGTSGASVADFGSGLPVNFSGQTMNSLPSAFTVGGWTRWLGAPDLSGPYVLFGATGQFAMTIDQNGFVSAAFTGGSGQVTSSVGSSSLAIKDGNWHFVLATFTPGLQSGGGILQLFIDGLEIDAENVTAAGSTTPADCVLGQNVDFMDFVSWCIWSSPLSTDVINVPIWGDPQGGTEGAESLVAAWDFANGPATDVSGNNHAVTVSQQNWISPGLAFADGYATPPAADTLNPGNGGPFTVSAWISAPSPAASSNYLVLSNGSAQTVLSVLTSYAGNGTGSVKVQYGQTQLSGPGTPGFAAGQWVHVAVAYDGTSALSLYLNGTPAANQSGVTAVSIPTGQLSIGGTTAQLGPTGYFMQAMTIWSTCLTQEEIAAYMYSDPTLATGCAAYYPLLTDTANTVTGSALGLTNSSLGQQVVPMQLTAEARSSRPLAAASLAAGEPAPVFPADIRALAAKLGIDPQAPVAATTSSLNVSAETAYFESLLKDVPAGIAGRLRTRFHENLTISQQLAARGLSPGMFTGATVGTDRVLYYHTLDGPQEVLRSPAADLDANTLWCISVVASVIGIVMSVFGILFSATNLANVLKKMASSLPGIRNLVTSGSSQSSCIESILNVINWLSQIGKLGTIIWAAIKAHWWSIGFAVASLLVSLAAMLVPVAGPAWLALRITDIVASLAQLMALLAVPPQGQAATPK